MQKYLSISIIVFLFGLLFIQESSCFLLSHSHWEIKNRNFLKKDSNLKLLPPNEKIVLKNYAKTFVKLFENDFSETNKTYIEEFVQFSSENSNSNNETQNINVSDYMGVEEWCSDNNNKKTLNETHSNVTNSSTSPGDIVKIDDYAFNITDFASQSVEKWDENGTLNDTLNLTNKEFLKVYDESDINGTDITNNEIFSYDDKNRTEVQKESDENDFLDKVEFEKYGEVLSGDQSNGTKIEEYKSIKNDTELEKELKTIINK